MPKNLALSLACMWVLSAGLFGCSSGPRSMEDVVKDQAKAEQARQEAEEKRQDRAQARMKKDLDEVPRWSLQPPKPDATGIYAVGIADSENLQTSMQKAMLQAEFGLAKATRQEISGFERSYTQDQGKAYSTQFTAAIDKLVDRVSVVGYEVVEQEVKPLRGVYTAFVLLKLPYPQFNKVLQEQRSQSQEARIRAEFDDLERRVKERQAERQREANPIPGANSPRAAQ
jgi:hypothetical protein